MIYGIGAWPFPCVELQLGVEGATRVRASHYTRCTHLFVLMGHFFDKILVVVSTLSTVVVQLLVETIPEEGRTDFHLYVTMYGLYFLLLMGQYQ